MFKTQICVTRPLLCVKHYFVHEATQTLRNYANCSIILIFNHPGSKKSGYPLTTFLRTSSAVRPLPASTRNNGFSQTPFWSNSSTSTKVGEGERHPCSLVNTEKLVGDGWFSNLTRKTFSYLGQKLFNDVPVNK